MTTTMNDPELDEVGALLTTLLATPATRLTACAGWTAHELVAHLAAGAAEEADLIEDQLLGLASRPTRAHAVREEPLRALPDAELRDLLIVEAARLNAALDRLGDEAVEFTGHRMTRADFLTHSRSECAIHRWDLVGRDDLGWSLLAQPDLTVHALTVLGHMATLPEAPANRLASLGRGRNAEVILRSEPHDDVILNIEDRCVTLRLTPQRGRPADVECDPAARLLLLWGRHEPSSRIEVSSSDTHRDDVVHALLGRP